jgi:DNA-binding NtrC family response regulator
MPITVVLAIGFDPWLFESKRSIWQSSGFFVTPTGTVKEAISHFSDGDFDAVLLGGALSAASRERIISLIRSAGATIPVVCVTEPSSNCGTCEFAATKNGPGDLLQRVGELLANPARKPAASTVMASDAGARQMSGRKRPMGVTRSGAGRRARRTALAEPDMERLPLLSDAESSCFTVCYRAATNADSGVGGTVLSKADFSR